MDNNFDILKELSNEVEKEIDIKQEEITKETIFQSNDIESIEKNEENILNLLIWESNIFEVKEKKSFNIFKNIWFLVKYLMTSSAIFFLILLTTNYSAYINIANSYLNKEKMEETQKSLINSVEATNITITESGSEEKNKKLAENVNDSFKNFIDTKSENPSLGISITPYENRIIIPKIWKNIPLIDIKNRTVSGQSELNDIFMKELENWVIRYPWSAKPGEEWNSFIFGHSSNFPWIKWEFNDVFALLDKVSYDDDVIVYYNQKKYTYKIKKKNIVSPGNVSILKPKHKNKELSIMTCRPIWTTLNRLVVTWELTEIENVKN